MATIIGVIVLLLIVGGAAAYLIRSKKNGVKCIGCPDGAKCGEKGCGNCGGYMQ